MAQDLVGLPLRLPVSVIHIIGAGLAGLSAAIELSEAGHSVRLYESARQAGGRCRSYFEAALNCRVDNGNHLVVSSNPHLWRYIAKIGAENTLMKGTPIFPFYDLADGSEWVIGDRRWPRIPGVSFHTILFRLLGLYGSIVVGRQETPFDRRFLSPLVIAALNTAPEEASAALTREIIRKTFATSRVIPYFAKQGLSESLVDPALDFIRQAGGNIFFASRLRQLSRHRDRITRLHFAQEDIELGKEDKVIMAVPPWAAGELLPEIHRPDEYRAIVNIHYATEHCYSYPFLGLVGGLAEWVFFKPDHLSVTISAADHCVDWDAEELARQCWKDLQKALGVKAMPAYRVVKEKRASFAATPAQLKLRPGNRTDLANLYLAGDWTDTGWPATIEGAVKSGQKAAQSLLSLST